MKQFIHIPKTGGTSVRFMQSSLDDMKYHAHGYKLSDVSAPNQAVFAIRHPLERLRSAVMHQLNIKGISSGSLNEFITQMRQEEPIEKQILFDSISNWLGTLDEYKQNEHLVSAAIETAQLSKYFSNLGVQTYHVRDHKTFNIEFDITVSPENKRWFMQKYAEDFKLYNYIKTRPYYVGA